MNLREKGLRKGRTTQPKAEMTTKDKERCVRLSHTTSVIQKLTFSNLLMFAVVEVEVYNGRDWKCQIGAMTITGDRCEVEDILSVILAELANELESARTLVP